MNRTIASSASAVAAAGGVRPEAPSPFAVAARRARADFPNRLWPTTLLFTAVSLLITLFNSSGRFVGDNRLEQYLNPARRLARTFSLWDAASGVGGAREDFWPGTTIPIAIIRGLGFGIATTERLWHTLCLVVAATGAVTVMRLFRPRIGVEHLICGALVAFSPFSVVFLLPSNLYFQYALGPWLLVAFVRGVREHEQWRWAAAFALTCFLAGNVDPPGLLANAAICVPAALYLVVVERSTTVGRVVRYIGRAALLSLFTMAAALTKTYFALPSFKLRLEQSESTSVGALTSSWPESIRGLGNWLSYIIVSGRQLKPHHEVFFRNPLVVLITFLPIVVAVVVLARSAWQPRVLFGAMTLQSLVLMVGGFPAQRPSPLGRALLWGMDGVQPLKGFRNTYKFGLGLTLGLGALCGMAVVEARSRIARHGGSRRLPLVLAGVVVTGLATPLWTGSMYDPDEQFSAVPSYWTDAFRYLERLPYGGRSMVVPATSRTRYRWGWVGDDILDSLDVRAHAVATGVPLSNPLSANLLEVLTLHAQDPVYRPGVIGPMARRLGITEIVVRNDLDWRALNLARPALFNGLRQDPDLELVASFGTPGDNVVGEGDDSAAARAERLLAPVEIYRVRLPAPIVRIGEDRPALVVSGDGGAYPELALAGLLGGDEPVVYSADSDSAGIVDELRRGGSVVISDSNRRRVRRLVNYEPDYSGPLAEGQDRERPASDIFAGTAGSQSVAWYPDATRIIGHSNVLGGETTEFRPAMAFDADPTTAWRISRYEVQLGRTMRVELRRPKLISGVHIQPMLDEQLLPTITSVELRFDTGSPILLEVDGTGRIDQSIRARLTSSIELSVVGFDRNAGSIGLVDVGFDGVDLREFTQVPDDLLRASNSDSSLRAALRSAPLAYMFRRVDRPVYRVQFGYGELNEQRPPEEQRLRRRFWTLGSRAFDVVGTGHLRRGLEDVTVNRLLGRPIEAVASASIPARRGAWAFAAVDGDPLTAWQGPPVAGTTVSVTTRVARPVSSVRIVSQVTDDSVLADEYLVTVAGRQTRARPQRPEGCPDADRTLRCAAVAVASFAEPVAAVEVQVAIVGVTKPADLNALAVRIDEIEINGERNPPIRPEQPLAAGCLDLGIAVSITDDVVEAVPVMASGNAGGLLAGADIPLQSCSAPQLGEGWHALVAGTAFVDRLKFTAADAPPAVRPPAISAPLELAERSAGRLSATTATNGRSIVTLRNSFDPAWRLRVGAGAPQAPFPADGVNAWRVEEAGALSLSFDYAPDSVLAKAILVSLAAVIGCAWLLLARRRHSAPMALAVAGVVSSVDPPMDRERRVGGLVAVLVPVSIIAGLIAGPAASALGLAAGWAAWRSRRPALVPGVMAVIMVVIVGLSTLLQSRPDLTPLDIGLATRRQVANEFGAVFGACLAIVVAVGAWASRSPLARHHLGRGPTRRDDFAARALRYRWVGSHWAAAAAAAAASLLIGRIAGRLPLVAGSDALVANLRRGSAYSLSVGYGAPAVSVPPLGPAAVAFSGLPRMTLLVATLAALAIVVCRSAGRLGGRRSATAAAAALALLPASWSSPLSMLLAGLFALLAITLADPSKLQPARGALCGLCVGLAVLARPDAVLVALVIGAWWLRRRPTTVAVLVAAGSMVTTVAPWCLFVWAWSPGPWLGGSWSAMVGEPSALAPIASWAVGGLAAVIVWRAWRRGVPLAGLEPLLAVAAVACIGAAFGEFGRDPFGWAAPAVAVALGGLARRVVGAGQSPDPVTNKA